MPGPSPKPTIAITAGDPGGIGPETIVKALADPGLRDSAHFRIYGPTAAFEAAAGSARLPLDWLRAHHASPLLSTTTTHAVVTLDYPGTGPFLHEDTRSGGDVSFRLVDDAITDALRPRSDARHVDAIVTGPISKRAWAMAGHDRFPGHTELFAARCGSTRFGMMFVSPTLRVILATAHIPLLALRHALTTERILDAIDLGHDACRKLGIERPRIAVCGLNPHAGEQGVLGDEDQRIIEPAIRAAAARGIDARGPFPGDTVFIAAAAGRYDLVVAMYHDQGLIPVKLLHRDRAVNMTVGLPIIRTSPDHGTAFDIAGQNKADPGSMTAAIALAVQMCPRDRTGAPR